MDVAKASQMTALFLLKAGGPLSRVRMMKLLYFADRESLKRYGESITGDAPYSMPQGPVLTTTYDLMKGEKRSPEWEKRLRDVYHVELREGVTEESLDDLSQADVEIIDEVWDRFGGMDEEELVAYVHGLPEWTDPAGSSLPIDFRTLLKAVGIPDDEAEVLAAHAGERAALESLFERDRVA